MENNFATEIMTFPCSIAIKVMGYNKPEFEPAILAVFSRFFPDLKESAITQNMSKNQNFLSLTVSVNAASKAQLDELYCALTENKHSLFVL